MTSWKQSGNKNTEYSANDPDCFNTLKTNVELIGPDSKSISVSETEQSDDGPVPTWMNIPEGSKIKWEALTETDGKGQSDRLNLELTVMDGPYVAKITDDVLNNLSPAEEDMLLSDVAGLTTLVTKRVIEDMNPELVMKSIYSTIINTNEGGLAEGEIPIPIQWPKGAYSLILHYGYHAQSEAADSEKAFNFWVEEMGPMIAELVIMIIIGFFFPPSLAVTATVFTAALVADMAIMYSQYQKDGFGATGLDQYGCAFPDGGWNHTYAIGYETEEAEADMAGEVSPQNAELLAVSENYIQAVGMTQATLIGTMMVGLLFILVARIKTKKGRKSDG
jgi:hypothetical protein